MRKIEYDFLTKYWLHTYKHYSFHNHFNKMSSSQIEHLTILQKLHDSVHDILIHTTATHTYAAAIYDTWSQGTELEKNLANRLVDRWHKVLLGVLTIDYRYHKETYTSFSNLKSHDEYCKNWVESRIKMYAGNAGLQLALQKLLESNRDTPT